LNSNIKHLSWHQLFHFFGNLLDKQKKGKKRMRSVGRVDIPQEAFLAVLHID
jgi:hypothetical protein